MSIQVIMSDDQTRPPKNAWYYFKKYFLLYLVVIGLGGSFVVGYTAGKDANNNSVNAPITVPKTTLPQGVSKDVDFNLFWDVWQRVKKDYVDKSISDKDLFYGALSGIVASVDDPYTVFLDPETTKKFEESLSGSFDGIGAEIGKKNEQIVIMAPLPDTPAERAGLKTKDMILAIDKKTTAGITLDEAVIRIRGKKGTSVTLTIYREGEKKERDVSIMRDTIQIKSVVWNMKKDIAYVKVSHFNEDTESTFGVAIREAMAKKPKGFILDLRNNPGGFLDTAVEMASYWVNGKTIVVEKYNEKKQDSYTGHAPAFLKDMPTIVLVNEGSASASEIVAGALQDYGKATIIGKKTFGKGSVQDLQRLRDGSAIKITVAKWYTPNGKNINEEGIKPDREVSQSEDDDNKDDLQLNAALELLRK